MALTASEKQEFFAQPHVAAFADAEIRAMAARYLSGPALDGYL